jgi:hypothetical protein
MKATYGASRWYAFDKAAVKFDLRILTIPEKLVIIASLTSSNRVDKR